MSIFLTPIPIVHAHAMLDDANKGHQRFAFGSNAIDFFERKIATNCIADNITAYFYVSQTGQGQLSPSVNKQLGIRIKGRLCGWTMADRRGQYPKDGKAHRPATASTDGPMTLFWEIDNIEQLANRKPISDFVGAESSKHYEDGFIPQGPLWVSEAKC